MKLLENKWAVVTGSSRGVGQKIAIGLAERKCNVIVHARSESNTEESLSALKNYDIKSFAVHGDLAISEDVDNIIDQIRAAQTPIDILYNNAAIQNEWSEIWDISQPEWERTFQVNLYAVIKLCNAFAPGMKQRGFGRIINLTSGIMDIPQLAPYSVSKAAIDKYSRDLAAELKGTNVLVNYLDPGWLKTDMGGEDAENEVSTVLPGALIPALLDDYGPSGKFYAAQDYKDLEH